jgi:hypothetical protein
MKVAQGPQSGPRLGPSNFALLKHILTARQLQSIKFDYHLLNDIVINSECDEMSLKEAIMP